MPIEFSRQAQQAFTQEFKARIMQVYGLFPELQDRRISCGLLKGRGWVEGTATGWTSPPVFRLQPNVSSYTIAHELTHLVRGTAQGYPTARSPATSGRLTGCRPGFWTSGRTTC